MMTLVRNIRLCGGDIRVSVLSATGLAMAFLVSMSLCGCSGSIATNLAGTKTTAGSLVVSSSSVAFGTVAVGQAASVSVTLTNQGSSPVKVSQLNVTGQSFAVNGQTSLPATISANASLTLTVQFNPVATGPAAGQLTITSNSTSGSSTSVSLSGTGVPVLSALSCTSGSIVGAVTDTCSVTLNAAASSGGLSVSLASSSTAVAVPSTLTVPAGATSAAFPATISAVSSAQGATLTANLGGVSQSFALELNAAVPALSLSTSSLAFGNVPVNSAITQPIILSSTGTGPVTINAAALAGTGFVAAGQTFPLTLNSGQTATLNVQFAPSAAGPATGQLTLTSNSLSGGSAAISLSGTGVPVLNALTCSAGSITGTETVSCSVALSAASASGGFAVTLASSNSLVRVPAAVTVPAGSSSAAFTASVSPTSSSQSATLTASAGGVTQSFTLQLNASGPTLSLSSSSVDFGNVAVNILATQTLTLSSTGGAAVTISAASLSGTGFTAAGATFPLTLNPNQTTTLILEFDPTATGSTTGQLSLTSNSADGAMKRVGLAGRGVPRVNALSCSQMSMTGAGTDTCTVALNSAADSAGLLINLSSNNGAVRVPSTVTVAGGATSASFPATVSAVNVAQSVTVSASAGGITKATSLQLGAAAISLTLSTNNLVFGNVNVHSTATQSVTLSSTGAAAVTVSAATVAGTGFTISGVSLPLTLNPNQAATLNVLFDPTAAGATSGTVTLTSNSLTGTSSVINLSGTGVPVLSGLSCSSGSMSGTGTDGCTVTLNAAAAGSALQVNLSSSNSAVTVPGTVTVPVGASSASFTATIASVSPAQTVTLTATAGGAAQTFALKLGTGTPTLSINAASIAFGNVNLNTPTTQSVTLTSTGSAAVTISAATVTGTGFTVTGVTLPLTLNPNQTATLNVQFDPTTAGAASGTLTIASNSSTGAATGISLSGTGVNGSSSGSDEVDLSWDAPSSSPDPVAGYNVYRSPSSASAYQQLNSSVLTGTTFTDLTVQAGQSYDYIVESVDASGIESSPSNIASATIP